MPQPAPNPGEWRNYPTAAPVTALAAYGETIWAGTTQGLVQFDRTDGMSVTITTAEGLIDTSISTVAVGPDGNPWVGTWNGNISRFDGQRWRNIRLLEAPEDNVFLSAIVFDDPGQVWYSQYGYGVFAGNEHFTSANGLAEDYVLAMAANGPEMWVGTRLGLSRYSRNTWTTFTKEDGLTSATITALAAGPGGQIWAGTYDGGVNRLDSQGWTGFTTADGLPDNRINALAVDAAGRPWIATPKGVSYFDTQNWTTYSSADGLPADNVKAVAVADDGHIWFGTDQGLTEFVPPPPAPNDNIETTAFTTADGLADDRIWTIAVGPDGRAWFGTYEHGVSVFDGHTWTNYTTAAGLADNDVRAIMMDPAGRIWFGTGLGVTLFDGQNWRIFRTIDGLASNGIESLALDSQGHIWAAHLAEGVSRFDGASWTRYTVDDGLADNWVHDLAVGHDGRVWLATNGGVSVFDGQSWTTFTSAAGLVGDTVFALAVDAGGHIWAGTTEGVSEYDGQHWLTHLPGQPVNDLALDSTGAIWTAGSDTVNRFAGQHWTEVTPASLAGQDIRAVAAGPGGQVWIGTFGGGVTRLTLPTPDTWMVLSELDSTFTDLVATSAGPVWAVNSTQLLQFEAETHRAFDLPGELKEEIAANASVLFSTITDLAATEDGAVWLATREAGLYRFAEDSWQHFGAADGLPGDSALRLVAGGQNRLWAIFAENDVYTLAYFDDQQWQSHPLPDIDSTPTGLAVTPAGQLWLAVSGRAPFLFDGSQWRQPREGWQAGSFDMFLAASPAGTIWFGSDDGWQRWTDQRWENLQVTIPAPFSFPAAVDASGGAWGIVTPFCYWCKLPNLNENGAVYVTPEQSCRFTAADGLGDPPLEPPPYAFDPAIARPDAVQDIAVAADGRVWFITQGKLTVFNPQNPVCDYAAPENVRQPK